MQSPGWRPTVCVHRCLIWWYASLTKRMVMHDTDCPYWDYVSLNKKNPTPWSHGNKHYWVHGNAKVCPYCLMNEWKCHSLLIYWMNTYCRVLDISKSFSTRVSWGSFLRQKSRNIMLAYKSRMPDLTLAKLKHWKRQTYHNYKLNCLGTLSILQYICSRASKHCESLYLCFFLQTSVHWI